MSGEDYFVDTNVLIHLLNGEVSITEFLDKKLIFISFISEMELLSKPGLSAENIRIVKSLIENCVLIDFNNEIKQSAIKIRKDYKLKIPDAIVAASANYLALPLITFDKEFKKVKNLEILHITL